MMALISAVSALPSELNVPLVGDRLAGRQSETGFHAWLRVRAGTIAGAALDCAWDEPLPDTSPLWTAPNVFITPHSAGETQKYEDNVIDLLIENLARLSRGETLLKNEFV